MISTDLKRVQLQDVIEHQLPAFVREDFPLIEVSTSPYSNDVIGLQDLYLQLDSTRTVINTKPDNISSGNDITGTNYIVSSSYANGLLVR